MLCLMLLLRPDAAALAALDAVRKRMSDDLDAPGALAVVDAGPMVHWLEGNAAGGALIRNAVDALLGIAL